MSQELRINNNKFIDQTTRLSFKFNGEKLYGYKGDTLASALLANNIHLVGRSFKYQMQLFKLETIRHLQTQTLELLK